MNRLSVTLACAGFLSVAALGTPSVKAFSVPVSGDLTNRPGKVLGSFSGELEILEFVVEDGQLLARGILTGQSFKKNGKRWKSVSEEVSLPVESLAGEIGTEQVEPCEILHLELGPLNLQLLGLIVDLDIVVLDITADPALGILGDLLCAINGLLDGLDLGGAAGLLNQLLDLLGGVLG